MDCVSHQNFANHDWLQSRNKSQKIYRRILKVNYQKQQLNWTVSPNHHKFKTIPETTITFQFFFSHTI